MPTPELSKPFCVQFHDAVRQAPPPMELRQLGSGLPESIPFSHLKALLTEGLAHVFDSGAVASFGPGAEDPITSELCRSLSEIVRSPVTDEQFLTTVGASDGLSSILDFCGDHGIGVVLPLPCYFGYELAALNAGVRIAGYYDAATTRFTWRNPGGPLCLVVNTPDAISGYTLEIEGLRSLEAQLGRQLRLTVVDLICAMQRPDPAVDSSSIADLWGNSTAPGKALLFGVTKDLALPGLRAGLLLSDDLSLLEGVRWRVLGRSFSAGVFVPVVMGMYLHLLASIESRKGYHIQSEVFPGLTSTIVNEFHEHRKRDSVAYQKARSMLNTEVPELLLPSPTHQAGYSVLATMANGVKGVDAAKERTQRLLTQGLKINPTYMFGGDPDLWNALRPGELHLRVNLSTPASELGRDASEAVRALRA